MSSRDNSVKKAVYKIVCRMFLSAQAAITKLHRLGSPYNSYLSSQVLEAGSPRPRCRQMWPCKASLPGLRTAVFSQDPHMVFFLRMHIAGGKGERDSALWCFFLKGH